MKTNKLYTILLQASVNPVTDSAPNFRLNCYQSGFFLRSVYLSGRIINVGTGELLPLDQNTSQRWSLWCSRVDVATQLLCSPFENISVPAAGLSPGRVLEFYQCGQYKFENVFFENSVLFTFSYRNNDALDIHEYRFSVAAEIEVIK